MFPWSGRVETGPELEASASRSSEQPEMSTRPSTEQLLVHVLMRSWQELLRTFAESEGDSAENAQARREVELAFAPIWNRMPYFEVTCIGDGLHWNDVVVLTPEEDGYGLARTLTTSGIHAITLVPGVEELEMARFLELIDRKRRLDEDGDQDLVLMLFRADLHHIRYTVGPVVKTARAGKTLGVAVEVASVSTPVEPDLSALNLTLIGREAEDPGQPDSEEADPGGHGGQPGATSAGQGSDEADPGAEEADHRESMESGRPDAEELRSALREDASSPGDTTGVVNLEQFDSTLYFLDQKEIEYLRTAIEREYSRDHSRNALELLLDILQLRSDPAVRNEVIGVLRTLLPYLLATGRFPAVAYLTRELRKITRTVELTADEKQALEDLRVSVSRTDTLTQLFHVLEQGDVDPTAEELGVLLREMRYEAIQTALVWIGQLKRPGAKAALVTALEGFFREWPAALGKMTESQDRTVVQRALGIAAKLQLEEFTDPITPALTHDDPATRRMAVAALTAIGSSIALKQVAGAIDDDDAEVRTVAFESLSARPFRGARKGLVAAIRTSDLESRELSERRALFSAFGMVSGAGGVPVLEPILQGKGGLARRPSSGTRACAALALGVINTPAARFALDAAAKDRDPLVRSAANAALRSNRS
jgi:HEAT repeat protein